MQQQFCWQEQSTRQSEMNIQNNPKSSVGIAYITTSLANKVFVHTQSPIMLCNSERRTATKYIVSK